MPAVGVGRGGARAVLHRRHSDETAGFGAGNRVGVDSGVLQHPPRDSHRDPLLGVEHQCLAVGDAEERRIELRGVVQESAGVADLPPSVELGR